MTPPPRVLGLPGGEPILHYGAKGGPQLLVLQPLFEEANRCRAFVARLCRDLAGRGYGAWLPDLPGTGESERALETVGWDDWATTISDASALGGTAATIAIRGGALLDTSSPRRWRLSPVAGASLLTDLRRSGLLAGGAYRPSPALSAAIDAAEPGGAARTLRLAGDERPCDRQVEGPALWRRPEPADAPALAATLAADIDAWFAR